MIWAILGHDDPELEQELLDVVNGPTNPIVNHIEGFHEGWVRPPLSGEPLLHATHTIGSVRGIRLIWIANQKERTAEVITSDPLDDGYEVNTLFRTQAETGFSPTKSGIPLRLSVSTAALNQFMAAFAKTHDDLKLRDEWLSEEQGTFVRAQFRWPPEA